MTAKHFSQDCVEIALANLKAGRISRRSFLAASALAGAGAVACTGTVSTGAINTAQAWMDHLLMASDQAGHTCTLSDGVTYRSAPASVCRRW